MVNKHFFQPLLPGFHSHLTIPVAFFSKSIKGRNEQNMAKLRSDASNITWKVKVEDGLKLTDGWKEFALAHDLRIGDILIFRQEKDMAFHVTLLGPSCCEIQYESCLDDENDLGKIPEMKKVKKNPRKETESSSLDPSCFVANVTPSNLRSDTLILPRSFVKENGLLTRCGEIALMNEKGTSWKLNLKQKNVRQVTYIRGGWRIFCHANGIRAGDCVTFKLIQRGETLVLRKSPSPTGSDEEDCSSESDEIESLSTESDRDGEESNQDEKSFKKPRSTWKVPSSQSPNRFVTLPLSAYNVEKGLLVRFITPRHLFSYILSSLESLLQFLPASFTRMNGINEESQMSLLDKHGVKWSTNLRSVKGGNRIRMVGGWKEFFRANCVKIGESIMLKLIWEEDKSCVLKFCSKVKQETKPICIRV